MDDVTLNKITQGLNAVVYNDSLQRERAQILKGQTHSCEVGGWNAMVKEQL